MDPRLLRYYNTELDHLRDMGAEFARQFPKIAGRLGMDGIEVADPYVERLLEGFAFLAARVQLKLDAELPRFTQAMLEMVYPHYLAPTPAMAIVELQPDPNETNLAKGFPVARGSALHATLLRDDVGGCEFRTAQDVTLWPIEVVQASYFTYAPDLPLTQLGASARIKGGVRLRLRATAGLSFRQIKLDRLALHLSGGDDTANRLYELLSSACLGALVVPIERPVAWHHFIEPRLVSPSGFEDDEALLPVTLRSFQGYRLMQEYFAFPQRFRFVAVSGLATALARADGTEIEIVLLVGRADAALENVVDRSNFRLHCTPAINLFPKRADRIHVTDESHEYHVVPDRTRPMDFEVYEVTRVMGHGVGAESLQEFRPFYAAYSSDEQEQPAYFSVRREPRLLSSGQKRNGARSSYIGTEVFLSLVDPAEAPFRGDLRQLAVETLCTNRDLVLQMPLGGGRSDFALDVAAPVTAIRVVAGPSRPYSPLASGAVSWRAINHLALNYLSLSGATPHEAASGLRELLELYAVQGDAMARRQIDGIKSVAVRPVVRRLPAQGPLTFGRGLEVTLELDELAYEGGSAFLLAAVLRHFLSRHASINSFTETVLRSRGRGEVHRWVPMWGERPIL